MYRHGAHIAYLLLYVDDIILTGSCPQLLSSITMVLGSDFAMSDLGDLHFMNYFYQVNYIFSILQRHLLFYILCSSLRKKHRIERVKVNKRKF